MSAHTQWAGLLNAPRDFLHDLRLARTRDEVWDIACSPRLELAHRSVMLAIENLEFMRKQILDEVAEYHKKGADWYTKEWEGGPHNPARAQWHLECADEIRSLSGPDHEGRITR